MLNVSGLRSWNLNADNLEEMVRFYCQVLGAEEVGRHSVGGVEVARLRLGNLGLGLFDASQGARPGVPHHTVEFQGWPDSASAIKELESNGIRVEDVRLHGEGPGYSLYVTDPSGNRIELSTDPG